MKHRINLLVFVVLISLNAIFLHDSPLFVKGCYGIALLFLSLLSIGVVNLRFQYFMKAITKVQTNEVLLTFDDGPDLKLTPLILDTLKEHGVKAVFFLIGKKAKESPDVVRRIVTEGHLIGNHTYSHFPFFSLCNASLVGKEIDLTNEVIKSIAGESTALFRPPIGYSNPIIAKAILKRELKVVGWNKRSFDTVLTSRRYLKARMLMITKPGSILLLHDNLEQTQQVLHNYLVQAKHNGIIFAKHITIESITS
jgi:peptidoglycan/xylan/chitin deacetylase (PgdA/CDA1 family)